MRRAGMAMGFAHVQASPLTRSSYHAREAAELSAPDSVPGRRPTVGSTTAVEGGPAAPAVASDAPVR